MRRWLERRGPYQSLAILGIPFVIVEPSKLAAVAIFGAGHWFRATAIIIIAYGLSIFVVERLFRIVKPNLLKLHWFAVGWRWFTRVRTTMVAAFTK